MRYNSFKRSIALAYIASWNVLMFLKIVTKWREIQELKLNNSLTNWAFQKKFFKNWFCRIVHFKNYLFFTWLVLILPSIMWPHFPPKTVKIWKTKTYDCLEYKVLQSCKVRAQTDTNFKSSSLEYNFRRKADLAFFEIPTILRFHNSAGRLGKTPPIIQYGLRLFGREISSLEVTTVAV